MLKSNQSPLQILLQIGFPKHRAEKALAATGNQSAEIATNWLLSHVNDPFLDDNSPREYILYACPKGPLSEQLEEFWEKSLNVHGRNGAHNFTPHITLVSFFKTPDEHAPYLAKCLESVMERDGAVLNEPFKLEAYTSRNFMGFFVAEEHADYLKRIAMQYVKEVSNAIISDTYEHFDALTACFPWCTTTTARCIPRGSRSISHEPHAKSLHLTLAYQFPNNQFNGLKAMVENLDPNAAAEWELRLYSRDTRVNGKQVYKVIREYVPQESDDLELKIGDYLYGGTEASGSSATDGWLEGTSWTTGCSGYFPESHTRRVPESDVWTLHKSVSLTKCQHSRDMTSYFGMVTKAQIEEFLKDRLIVDLNGVVYATNGSEVSKTNQRNIFVLRHAERVDCVFGKWIPHCFDEAGKYIRKDLNLPPSIPPRKAGPEGYNRDSPLTTLGHFHAKSIGEVFASNSVDIDYVYCSPSFRCLQTADAFLQGLDKKRDIEIRIEPSLFEWTLWYPSLPDWMSLEEVVSLGFNIDTSYEPLTNVSDLEAKESLETFYSRSVEFSKKVIEDHPSGNVLIVGHSATLDTMTRHLLPDKGERSKDELIALVNKIPYCGLVQVTQEGDSWRFVDPPCPPMSYCVNHRFDWKTLLSN